MGVPESVVSQKRQASFSRPGLISGVNSRQASLDGPVLIHDVNKQIIYPGGHDLIIGVDQISG